MVLVNVKNFWKKLGERKFCSKRLLFFLNQRCRVFHLHVLWCATFIGFREKNLKKRFLVSIFFNGMKWKYFWDNASFTNQLWHHLYLFWRPCGCFCILFLEIYNHMGNPRVFKKYRQYVQEMNSIVFFTKCPLIRITTFLF